jgi:hypothetical protein
VGRKATSKPAPFANGAKDAAPEKSLLRSSDGRVCHPPQEMEREAEEAAEEEGMDESDDEDEERHIPDVLDVDELFSDL